MAGPEHLVQHVKVDAVALKVVFNGSKPEVDEHHASVITDHDVVRRQVPVGYGLSVQVANRLAHRMQQRLDVHDRRIAKDLDKRTPLDVFQDQTVLVHIGIQQRWNRKTSAMKAKEDTGFRQHPLTTEALIEVGMPPSTGSALLHDRG